MLGMITQINKINKSDYEKLLSALEEDRTSGKMTFRSLFEMQKHEICPFVNKNEAANILGVTERVLENYQTIGAGPTAVKHGHFIKYPIVDLLIFSDNAVVAPKR